MLKDMTDKQLIKTILKGNKDIGKLTLGQEMIIKEIDNRWDADKRKLQNSKELLGDYKH